MCRWGNWTLTRLKCSPGFTLGSDLGLWLEDKQRGVSAPDFSPIIRFKGWNTKVLGSAIKIVLRLRIFIQNVPSALHPIYKFPPTSMRTSQLLTPHHEGGCRGGGSRGWGCRSRGMWPPARAQNYGEVWEGFLEDMTPGSQGAFPKVRMAGEKAQDR